MSARSTGRSAIRKSIIRENPVVNVLAAIEERSDSLGAPVYSIFICIFDCHQDIKKTWRSIPQVKQSCAECSVIVEKWIRVIAVLGTPHPGR